MPSVQEAWSRQRFTISQAVNILVAYIDPNRPDGTFPWQKADLIAIPCLVGEAGNAKTSVTRQVAKRLNMEFRSSHVGARAFEDGLGIPGRDEDPDNPGHHIVMAPPGFPAEAPLRGKHAQVKDKRGNLKWVPYEETKHRERPTRDFCGYGLYFHDEVMTADADKQNQLRDMFDNRRIGMLQMGDNWFQTGATNPPTRGFVTVKRMDRAVEDRMVYIPVEPTFEEVMGYWEVQQSMPDQLYKFLLWREGAGFKGTPDVPIGPRRWVLIGDMIENLNRAGADVDMIFECMSANLTPEHAASFREFLEFGDDQTKYPLRPSDFMTPEKSEMAIDIMKRWKAESKSALMGASVMALRSWIQAARADDSFNPTDENLACMARMISDEVINLEHAQSMLSAVGGSTFGPKLVEHMLKSKIAKPLMAKLTEASNIAKGRMKKK